MARTGLLLLTRGTSLAQASTEALLRAVAPHVDNRLYVAVHRSAVSQSTSTSWDPVFEFLAHFYAQAHRICKSVDVRIFLECLKYPDGDQVSRRILETSSRPSIDGVFLDRPRSDEIFKDLQVAFQQVAVQELNAGFEKERKEGEEKKEVSRCPLFLSATGCETSGVPASFEGVVLGGTFDRLHNGHKILLSTAAILSRRQFTCGVTDGPMLLKKKLYEMIEPVENRIGWVKEFVEDVDSTLNCKVVPITDPFGPSTIDTNLDCIVASKETIKGARLVNEQRKNKGMNTLRTYIINLAEELDSGLCPPDEDSKISSSKLRRYLLGTLLRQPTVG